MPGNLAKRQTKDFSNKMFKNNFTLVFVINFILLLKLRRSDSKKLGIVILLLNIFYRGLQGISRNLIEFSDYF